MGRRRTRACAHFPLHVNAGKRSIALDLKQPAGEALLQRAEGSDVLSERLPKAMARLASTTKPSRRAAPRSCTSPAAASTMTGSMRRGRRTTTSSGGDRRAVAMQQALRRPRIDRRHRRSPTAHRAAAVYSVTAAQYARPHGQGQSVRCRCSVPTAQFILTITSSRHLRPPIPARGFDATRPYATNDVPLRADLQRQAVARSSSRRQRAGRFERDRRFASQTARGEHIDAVYA